MNKPIQIHKITGGPDGNELKKLYFQQDGDSRHFHLFHDDTDKRIDTDPPNLIEGEDFTFQFHGLAWKVTDFRISETKGKAKGNWHTPSKDHGEDPESGTFQASSGGSLEAETKAAAYS